MISEDTKSCQLVKIRQQLQIRWELKELRSITATPLHDATESGDVDKVRQMMEQGKYEVNCTDSIGWTPLHYACALGNIDMARVLISEFRADTSIQDVDGRTVIMLAALAGHDNVVHALLSEYQCSADTKDNNGVALVHYACGGGNIDIVRSVIEKHSLNINVKTNNHNTPLQIAALNGQEEVALALINEFRSDSSIKGLYGCSVLENACRTGSATLVRTLLREHNADVNANNNILLKIAVYNYQEEVALILLKEFGCDPNTKDFEGSSILHNACQSGSTSLIRTLIKEHNTEVNARNNDNDTPLHIAAKHGREKVVLALINEFSCDPTMKGAEGLSVLHYACQNGSASLVRTLIQEHNADVNITNNDKNTPLHIAAKHGQEEVVLALINEFGCDPNMKGFKGLSVLHYACQKGSASLVRTLIQEHNADVNITNNDNNTPLHIAALHRQENLALALINEFGCDPYMKGYKKKSLLHSACQGDSADLVKTLLQEQKLSPLLVDSDGDTPLHTTCAAYNGCNCKCLNILLEFDAPIMIRNKAGKTPMEVASPWNRLILHEHMKWKKNKIYHHYDAITRISKKEYSVPQHITRIFVVGNPGAGKSSLIEAMKREGFFESFQSVSETSVPLHTAGIIPSTHHSRHLGRVLFYDFAGDPEYYSSHAAILEQLAVSKKGTSIFIIVVDLREDDETIKSVLHYWVTFIKHQTFSPFIIFAGSHSDFLTKNDIKHKYKIMHDSIQHKDLQNSPFFSVNCCKPRSKEILSLQAKISNLIKHSPQYQLSLEASILLGLLKKDFNDVPVCTAEELIRRVMETHICLPTDYKRLRSVIYELHELGLILMIEGQDSIQLLLSASLLCNKVHKLLFSEDGKKKIQDDLSCSKMGIIPTSILYQYLPEYITVECLVQLQYCQKLHYKEAGTLDSLTSTSLTDKTFLFFPALISSSKKESEFSWQTSPDSCYSVSWLAECTEIGNYFSQRFLHVLLLRLVFRFSVTQNSEQESMESFTGSPDKRSSQSIVTLDDVPLAQEDVSGTTVIKTDSLTGSSSGTPDLPKKNEVPDYLKRHCTMWKTGVHWLMEEGVECMVELVNDSKGVVITAKSKEHRKAQCAAIFSQILSCVMEARTEFCHDIKPQLFVLQSTDESNYLSDDNKFALAAVERVLAQPEQKAAVNSVIGKNQIESAQLFLIHKLIHWYNYYPLDFIFVLHNLEDSIKARNYPALSRVGIISHDELQKILPNRYTTSEFLQHQYCQKICLKDLGNFPNLSDIESSKPFLFFPALLSMEKSGVVWKTPSTFTKSIGWLVKSKVPFPRKFLHILLLRVAFRFTVVQEQASTLPFPHNYTSRCSMWRRGVYWFMKEGGAECMVELVEGNRSVVVTTKCEQDMEEECMHVLSEVVRCVGGVLSDLCPSCEINFYLLDSTEDSDFLDSNNHFALSEVREFLKSSKLAALLSLTGRRFSQPLKLAHFYKLAHWYKFFPLDRVTVLKYLKVVVSKVMNLGLHLDLHTSILEEIEKSFPFDYEGRRREVVKRWMSSTHTFPCWWHLARALRVIEMGVLAAEIEGDHRDHIQLQEKLLTEANKSCRPDPEFLQSFAAVVGSDWQSLATSLQLGESIEKGKDLSPQDHAHRMLERWASREDATYSQLCTALKAIPLLQYGI